MSEASNRADTNTHIRSTNLDHASLLIQLGLVRLFPSWSASQRPIRANTR
jgi:hypothetical protein